ncbi:MAG: hypothetical protein GY854_19860 [Deltaproteobacteria bacterium]|nr:hypothetical protein [Deltaproteobacteria bacterium]
MADYADGKLIIDAHSVTAEDDVTVGDDIVMAAGSVITNATNQNVLIVPTGTGITQIGDAGSTSHSLAANDDLFVSGKIEVDGEASFDSNVILAANSAFLNSAYTAAVVPLDTNQTPNTMFFGVPNSSSNHIVIARNGDRSYDFAHAQQTNPTVYIQSANQTATEWLSYCHNQTDGVLDCGTGSLQLNPGGTATMGDGGTTNYAQFAADGELTLAGTARIYRKMIIPSRDLSVGGTAPDQTILGNYIGYSYDIGDDSVLTTELPNDWASGTDVVIEVDWYIDRAYATESGEVQWRAAWSACPHDASEAVDAPTHTDTDDSGDVNIPATAKTLTETAVETIPAASLAAGDEIGITLSRIAIDDGNDPGGGADPVVVNVYLKYTADKLGTAL